MALKRPSVATSGGTGPSLSPDPGGWQKSLGTLAEFLSALTYGDGAPRQTGTVMLMSEGLEWKAWLHDRDVGATAFLTARTPDALLKLVNDALEADRVPWRADRKAAGRK
jgi:hypothetical protein